MRSCLVFQINDVWLGDRCEGLAEWRELMGRSVAQTHPGSPCLLPLRLLIGLTTLPCCSHTHIHRHPCSWKIARREHSQARSIHRPPSFSALTHVSPIHLRLLLCFTSLFPTVACALFLQQAFLAPPYGAVCMLIRGQADKQ